MISKGVHYIPTHNNCKESIYTQQLIQAIKLEAHWFIGSKAIQGVISGELISLWNISVDSLV